MRRMTSALNEKVPTMTPNSKLSNATTSSEQTMESTIPESSTASATVASDRHKTVDMTMISESESESEKRQTQSPKMGQPYFPSNESLASSAWSSSGLDSETSDSYDWSTELDSDEESGSEDGSDFSSSLSGSSTSIDEDLEDIGLVPSLEPLKLNVPTKPMGFPLPPMPPKIEGLPLGIEGLPLTLESLKRDLEKVGRTIIASNVGCVAAERAQTLASINWLANHVPNAVLDHLGNEIRAMLDEEKNGISHDEHSHDDLLASIVQSDDMSEVSDLSDGYLKDLEFEHGNAPGVKEVVEGSSVAQTGYGDLANFAHARAASFLPVDCAPAPQRLASAGVLAGIDEMAGMSSSNLLPTIGFIPEEEKPFPPHNQFHSTHRISLADIMASAGPEDPLGRSSNSQSSVFSDVSDSGQEHRCASMPSIKLPPGRTSRRASTGMSTGFPHCGPGMIGNTSDHRGKSSGKAMRRSTNGTEWSSSMASGIVSEKSSKSTKSKGVKGLFKRFVKRSKSDTKAMRPDQSGKHNNPPSTVDSMKCGAGYAEDENATKSDMHVVMPASSELPPADHSDELSDDDSEFSESLLGSSAASSDDESGITGGGNALDGRIKDKLRGQRLPSADTYHCALLFVDISGFTKLSNLLDPESLSKAINSYFQLIVSEVMEGKGDLLKFAGDAVFIEWKATPTISLENCVESAAKCAANIATKCSDYSILANGNNDMSSNLVASQGEKVTSLNVHCGIGAGQMVGVHVGDHNRRREYLLLGQPIQQATVATSAASLGEVCVSPEALGLLKRVCVLTDIGNSDGQSPTVISGGGVLKFASKQRMGIHQPKIINELSRGVTSHVEGLEVDDLRKYRRMMSLYVHPVVVDNDLAASDNFKKTRIKRTAQERHRAEAELRNVYVMFVNPKVEVRITKNEKKDRQMFKVLNEIMNLSSREIERYSGHLRQFIVDDKGLVMIITFGLRGTTIPNMVALRALPATIAIYNSLQTELGVQCKIGATFGEAYCGVVGGVKRHEYAVLGPSVNLAARLMSSKTNPGILVDNTVRMMANRSYGFNALPPVIAKGYGEPVPIFEPLSTLERVWGRILPNFVGRKEEILAIMAMARDMVLSESPSKFVIVESQSGMGKTTMVAHCIEHIRKLMGASKHRLIVTKNVSRESDALVPFGVFRSILLDVLTWYRGSADDKSLKSGASCYSSLQNSIAWESLSGRSTTHSTSNLSEGKSADILRGVCKELDMSTSFIEHALQSILGVDGSGHSEKELAKVKPPPAKTMVSFMARAFRRCTQDTKLVVVALDDLHHADDLSWKVIREIFETAHNVLFIGTSYPTDTCKLKIDQDFWDALNNVHKKENRFVSMTLGSLNKEEVASMIMKMLGFQRKEVKADLLEGVTIQSGGMPHFVNEILEHIKRQMAVDIDFEISDMTYESFGDLVLQRLDAFEASTRNMLNIGAVIGLSFTLEDLVAVQMRTSDATEYAVRQLTVNSLDAAVTEGILESQTGATGGDGEDNVRKVTKYSFYHAVWRSALLNLMLEGRKRDLHRTIAESMEEQNMGVDDYMFQTKLFNHWINSGSFGRAAELALTVGKHFEERLGLPAQSIKLYNDALDLVRESNDASVGIGGFTPSILGSVDANDLSFIVRVQVALGQALAMAQQMTESVTAFQDALRIVQAAKSSTDLKDRSILFPVFTGLSLALKRGHIVQDSDCRYEQAMIRRYVQETKLFGDPIHIIHAITLQSEMYGRLGSFDLALESHKQLEPIYNVEDHSIGLCDEYGSDLGAQSFASSSLWNLQVGKTDEALGTCWFVIEELMPKIEKRNVHASFMIMYPILWVMKENGFALEAREYFEEFVCEAYNEYYGEGRSTFFLPLYDPVLMLLDLAGNADVDEMMVEEYLEWALDIDNLGFGTLINSKTGELGRTADSVAAEICYLLAAHVEDEDDRATLIENGIEVATENLEHVKGKKLLLAEASLDKVLSNLESI